MVDDPDTFLKNIPLCALRLKSRNCIAKRLDPIHILPTSDGLPRDWRGILQLSELRSFEQRFSNSLSPTIELMKILENEPCRVTLGRYRMMLGDIDRWDVVDDTEDMFVDDALEYTRQEDRRNRSRQQFFEAVNRTYFDGNNQECLTIHDAELARQNLPPQKYDAFLLYAVQDKDFAKVVYDKLESFGFKLCVEEYLLAGIDFEHDAIKRLLTHKRCERLIVILSPDFENSYLNGYITIFTQSLGIADRKRKIIPCLYKPYKVSDVFHGMHLLDYGKSHFFNFWQKLKISLQHLPERRLTTQLAEKTDTHVVPNIAVSTIVMDVRVAVPDSGYTSNAQVMTQLSTNNRNTVE